MSRQPSLFDRLHQNPTANDAVACSFLAYLLVFNPYYLFGELNIFELELYLPGINAILHGAVPYRDFFYLRGPFELYVPAFFMLFFGKQVAVLSTFFYIGTIATLVLGILIAREIFKTRYVLLLFTLVFVARTFPRVVYTYWGGMRFALGLLAIYLLIQFFKRDNAKFAKWAGITTALSLLTSIDVGVSAFLAVCGCFLHAWLVTHKDRKNLRDGIRQYFMGMFLIVIPYGIYLAAVGALVPYFDAMNAVVTRLGVVINPHVMTESPQTFAQALLAMINPASENFRHMTPMYLYLILAWYLIRHIIKKDTSVQDSIIVCVGLYGLILFLANFRGFGGAQFEMALQPEKILLFFLLERGYSYLREERRKALGRIGRVNAAQTDKRKDYARVAGIVFLFIALFMSSVCFFYERFSKRFFTGRALKAILSGKNLRDERIAPPLTLNEGRYLELERGRGLFVPHAQATELEAVDYVLRLQTRGNQPILMYPERGIFHFLSDRPHIGRFPTTTLAWLREDWYKEFKNDILSRKPLYVVLDKSIDLDSSKYKIFFAYEPNKQKFDEVLGLINARYTLKHKTPASEILKLKNP